MPCCTLLAFVLGQIGLGAGAMKTRFAGKVPFALGGWKALGLAAIAGAEIVLASAALPLIFTAHGRADAAQSLHTPGASVRWIWRSSATRRLLRPDDFV